MRKITQFHDMDKPDPKNLLLAVDVSSRSLDLYSRYRLDGKEFEVAESFQNDLTTISDRLDEYAKQARGLGYNGLALVLEPSGRYEKKLTQAALQRGHCVWTSISRICRKDMVKLFCRKHLPENIQGRLLS